MPARRCRWRGRAARRTRLPAAIREAIRLFETHVEDPLRIPDVAAAVGLSGRHFERTVQARDRAKPAALLPPPAAVEGAAAGALFQRQPARDCGLGRLHDLKPDDPALYRVLRRQPPRRTPADPGPAPRADPAWKLQSSGGNMRLYLPPCSDSTAIPAKTAAMPSHCTGRTPSFRNQAARRIVSTPNSDEVTEAYSACGKPA